MSLCDDELYMAEAIRLARTQLGHTSPDPLVGAVVVKDGKIISRGAHAEQSTPHAEAIAIEKAGARSRGATLYLNLEPCCHYGYNPPCTQAVIKGGIRRVVASMRDPNPLVSGKGFRELLEAGIEVNVGVLADEAKKLNEPFIKHIRTGRPFVVLKSALSMDGKIATRTGDSKYISSKESRRLVHVTRMHMDAILTTLTTVVIDDPLLTVRDVGTEKLRKRNPRRIVIDPLAQIPLKSHILNDEPEKTTVVVSSKAPARRIEAIERKGADVIRGRSKGGFIDLNALMKELGKENIMGIMIEAGGGFAASALESGIVDKVMYFIAPKIIGGSTAPTPVEGKGAAKLKDVLNIRDVTFRRFDNDVLIEGYVDGRHK